MEKLCTKIMKPFSVLAIATVMLASCKDKPKFNDLTPVSYSQTIAPMMNSNCAGSGCHGSTDFKKFDLTNYAGLMSGGIKAGNPDGSKLYLSLKSLGDDIMPKKPYNELTEKQIQLVYLWIGQGAKNN
jgi:hypothetical protein